MCWKRVHHYSKQTRQRQKLKSVDQFLWGSTLSVTAFQITYIMIFHCEIQLHIRTLADPGLQSGASIPHKTRMQTSPDWSGIWPICFLLNFIAYAMPHAYATRERCNNARLLVFSLWFSTKYRFVLCSIRLCAIAVIRWRIVFNTVAIQKIVFLQGGDTGREVTVEIVKFIQSPQPSMSGGNVVSSSRGSGAEPQPKTVLGRFMRNFVPF